MERKCIKLKIGNCTPYPYLNTVLEQVVYQGRPVEPALKGLEKNVCEPGEKPVLPSVTVRSQSSARWRLLGR